MSTERKNTLLKRDQALNDATNGQLGEERNKYPYLDHRNLNLIILEIRILGLLVKCPEILFNSINLTYFLNSRSIL